MIITIQKLLNLIQKIKSISRKGKNIIIDSLGYDPKKEKK